MHCYRGTTTTRVGNWDNSEPCTHPGFVGHTVNWQYCTVNPQHLDAAVNLQCCRLLQIHSMHACWTLWAARGRACGQPGQWYYSMATAQRITVSKVFAKVSVNTWRRVHPSSSIWMKLCKKANVDIRPLGVHVVPSRVHIHTLRKIHNPAHGHQSAFQDSGGAPPAILLPKPSVLHCMVMNYSSLAELLYMYSTCGASYCRSLFPMLRATV